MGPYSTAVAVSASQVLQASSLLTRARGSWRPTVAALRLSASVKCRRRALTVTCALPEKERPAAFNIPPTALLCPVPPPDGKERWDIKEEDDRVTLWLQVPGLSASDIEVTTSEDVLEIKRRVVAPQQPAPVDAHGVGAFHIRLLLTKEYDGSNVTADLKAGMLEVTVHKNPQRPGERAVLMGATKPPPEPRRNEESSTNQRSSTARKETGTPMGRQNPNGV
ncbi:heat shock protein, chloroplastic [Zea mays]|uniref:Heat shock protein, chloroplastic n=1 Tax=Zea mays TaxID=4577 RepID=A0A317Y6A5_MAIZE|nr:heat shock protein, chloroplastic [Zea mays]